MINGVYVEGAPTVWTDEELDYNGVDYTWGTGANYWLWKPVTKKLMLLQFLRYFLLTRVIIQIIIILLTET